jgi:group I intron endonuclease
MANIYKITNPKGKIYIGQTTNLRDRMYHYSNADGGSMGKKILNSIKKYGWENHEIEVIEVCDDDKSNMREIYWIKHFNSYHNGLNLTEGGFSGKHSKETCLKKSKSMMGKTHTDETRKKMSESRKNHSMYTNEWKEKMKKGAWSSNTSSKPILQFDKNNNLIQKWKSSRKAALELNISIGNISSALNGRYKSAGGYVWKFVYLSKWIRK